jgi:hypothetical protein
MLVVGEPTTAQNSPITMSHNPFLEPTLIFILKINVEHNNFQHALEDLLGNQCRLLFHFVLLLSYH